MYKNIFSCEGKTAIVTGGCGLIGKEIVKGLKEFGATVYAADINKEKLDKLADNVSVKYIHCDITSESSIKNVVDVVIQKEGKIDILVNSAYPRTKDWNLKFEDVPYASWKGNIDHHLGGYFIFCRDIAEHMKSKGKGAIINLASIYGIVAPDFSIYKNTEMTMPVAYSAIKGGIISFTKYLAAYYAKFNVRANSISPGGVFNDQPESFVKKYSEKTPLGRMAKKEEIVGAVVFLASEASSYVTGHNLVIDGGWTIW